MDLEQRQRFWQGRSVAVTGATGFVGHHLATLLGRLGARVRAVVRATSGRGRLAAAGIACLEAGLDDVPALARACRGCEYVFHVAGAVEFEEDWERFYQVNVAGARNLALAARASGVGRLVHTSSIVAVGASREPRTLDESAPWNLGPLAVPYVTTKRQAEEAVLEVGGDAVIVNPASVIGPGDFGKSEFGTLCYRFWKGRLPFHFGGGNNFVDVRDVALGQLLAAERGRAGQRYLLGGTNRCWTAFFADLARAAGRRIGRVRLPNALGPVVALLNRRLDRRGRSRPYLTAAQARLLALYFWFDSGKARRELGYQPRPLPVTLSDAHAFWMGGAA
jgi:dihydroflavonol-4-reductase